MKTKKLTFYVSLIIVVCLLISVFSIFFDIGHSCACENEFCSVCEFYNGLHKSSGLLSLAVSFFFSFAILAVFTAFMHYFFIPKASLVGLCVKLSN